MLPLLAIILGFALLLWSADRFVEGAAATARHLGVNALLIGIVIVGFGTSAPEMLVSAMAALDGNPDLALGNAYGSNIINTGLVLGLTAVVTPIAVHSQVVRQELPLLLAIGLTSGVLLWDDALSRLDAALLLGAFGALVCWSVFTPHERSDALAAEVKQELDSRAVRLRAALAWLAAGLAVMVVSSRVLVWGAVEVAESLGVSDLVIGLTIVALGTSLPELATCVVAVRKREHDIALGNIVGSNMFNLLAVVGIAAAIRPMADVAAGVLARDWLTMMAMTVALFVMAYGFRGPGRINRFEGAVLLVSFFSYTGYLLVTSGAVRV